MLKRKVLLTLLCSVLILANLFWVNGSAVFASRTYTNSTTPVKNNGLIMGANGYLIPDYFGVANWAFSPAPTVDPISGAVSGGIRKFVDTLPQLGPGGINNLGQYLTVGVPDKTTYPGGGSGYTSAPTVIIDPPPAGGTQATATANITGNKVTGVVIVSSGSGYTTIPNVSFSGGGGMGTLAKATLTAGLVTAINLAPSDYYEIAVVEYEEKMHSDLPPTRLRGYVQLSTSVIPGKHVALINPDGKPILMPDGSQAYGVDKAHYLGPNIIVGRDTTVRVKFYNLLPTGTGGNLFLPVDPTIMGAGEGQVPGVNYTENRAVVHLHGNNTVWISDGTPYQWITPANENTPYPEGVSVYDVPDMPDPGPGATTLFYTNAQSARLIWYHDHSVGITRLNVYAGEAAGYIIQDDVEKDLINGTNITGVNPGNAKVIPEIEIPLVIQDKTFVDATLAIDPSDGVQKPKVLITDPTWAWGSNTLTDNVTGYPIPKTGDLWYPHVYIPVENPWATDGLNPYGRWMYGPWFFPPTQNIQNGPVPNEYYDPVNAPWEPPMRPGTLNPSMPGEAFMDTPVINGTLYPVLDVQPQAYRFRILNAANDRFFNLQMYVADPDVVTADGRTNTEVRMISSAGVLGLPPDWSAGIPDPATAGPDWIQIGTEGGFLPNPVVVPSQPMTWNMNAGAFNFGNVAQKSLFLGCAERADVIVDFSAYAGQTLILYNDSTAPVPAYVATYDFYTGDADQTGAGGAPPTIAGYGPNTRTIMQIHVSAGVDSNVGNVTVVDGGSNYNTPVVEVLGNSPVPAVINAYGFVDHITLNYTGSFYTFVPNVTLTGGGGFGATAVATMSGGRITKITLTNPGTGYFFAPTIIIDPPYPPGSPFFVPAAKAKASLTLNGFAITDHGVGYTSVPKIWIYDSAGTGSGAIGTASLQSPFVGPAYDVNTLKSVWAKGISPSTKRGVFEVSQDPIIIPQAAYNSAYGYTGVGTDTLPTGAADIFVQIFENSKTFRPINSAGIQQAPVTLSLELKAMHDEMGGAYDTMYGRMSGSLGLEVMGANSQTSQFLPYPFASPPVDIILNTDMVSTQIGTLRDGTQIWKIIHNGVDTHPIHVHLFNAQLINRVAWDGIMMGVDDNELGWKDTIRVNPLEMTIFALRPIAPSASQIPFEVPNSRRLIDPSLQEGAVLNAPAPAGWFDPLGVAIAQILNHYVNYGWEYVYHCHILAHEEMDMMHTISFAVAPRAPTDLQALITGDVNNKLVALTWKDNSSFEENLIVQRSTDLAGPWTDAAVLPPNTQSYTEQTGANSYFFQVVSAVTIGDTQTPGMPTVRAESLPAGPVAAFLPPNAPTNLAVTLGTMLSVSLTWTDNANNEAGFTIERANVTGGIAPVFTALTNVAPNAGTGTVSYTDTTVLASTTYQYRVMAFNMAGASAYTNVVEVIIPAPPATPTNLTAVMGTGMQVSLTWTDNASNENGFTIERATITVGIAPVFSVITTVGPNANTGTVNYTDVTVVDSTTYHYRVQAFNAGGFSAYSNVAGITTPLPPAAPTNLTAVMGTGVNVALSWTDNANNENGFTLERATVISGVAPVFAVLATTGPNANPGTVNYIDATIAAGTSYQYRVRAFNAIAASAYSNVASIAVPPPPAAPSNLTAVMGTGLQVSLTWTDNANNENGFTIERATISGGGAAVFAVIATVGPKTNTGTVDYTDLTAADSTTYHYKIQAFNAGGVSAYSNVAPITTPTIPATPTNLAAVMGTGLSVNLTWTDNANNETGFTIERAKVTAGVTPVFTVLATLGARTGTGSVSYNDPTVVDGASYQYMVRAFNVIAVSAYSNVTTIIVSLPVARPSSLTAVMGTGLSVSLSWRDNANNETGFTIERATVATGVPLVFSAIATVGPHNAVLNATYIDTTVVGGTAYQYRVRAFNSAVVSTYSNTAAITIPAPPAAPTSASAQARQFQINADIVIVSWTDVANETGYTIQLSTSADFSTGVITSTVAVNTTSLTSSNLPRATRYYIRVRAFNLYGQSAWVTTTPSSITTP